jgi:hypothetical protein
MRQKLKEEIREQVRIELKDFIGVINRTIDNLREEHAIDRIVERINKKQLKKD